MDLSIDPLLMLWLVVAAKPITMWWVGRYEIEGWDRYRRPWAYR